MHYAGPGQWLFMIIVGLIIVVPFMQLFRRAGFAPFWGLLMLIPFLGIIALYVLAFIDWAAENDRGETDA